MVDGKPQAERRVWFQLPAPDEDGYPPVAAEALWAVPLTTPSRFRIVNVPFFVEGIGVDDEIEAIHKDERIWFDSLVRANGHSTVRVFVENPLTRRELCEELAQLGCKSELDEERALLAIDVPPGIDYSAVADLLESGEQRGEWEYFEGVVRH